MKDTKISVLGTFFFRSFVMGEASYEEPCGEAHTGRNWNLLPRFTSSSLEVDVSIPVRPQVTVDLADSLMVISWEILSQKILTKLHTLSWSSKAAWQNIFVVCWSLQVWDYLLHSNRCVAMFENNCSNITDTVVSVWYWRSGLIK
jgi:hypothetical protein